MSRISCFLCEKPQSECRVMVGRGACGICDDCILVAMRILFEKGVLRFHSPPEVGFGTANAKPQEPSSATPEAKE